MYHIPLGEFVSRSVAWLLSHYGGFFDAFSTLVGGLIHVLKQSLTGLPWWALIILIALIAWRASSWRLAVGSALGLLLIYDLQLWGAFVDTLVLLLIATFASIALGIPLGILTACYPRLNSFVEPVLDFMQTMPSFVYLIPALMLFGLGIVPATFATVVFAMPPAIRLTRLGISQVPEDLVEVGRAFGSSTGQLLWKVQLPLATPTIMAGINQTMMLSLSMVVIAAMIGAGGFGQGVLAGISQMDIGKGFENGLAVVILAMILERLSRGFFKKSQDRSRKTAKTAHRNPIMHRPWMRLVIVGLTIASLCFGYFNAGSNQVAANKPKGTIRIGYVNWQEDVAVTYLWQELLKEQGYTVELKNLDVAPLYVGLSKGNLDLFLDGWLPVTQRPYWEKYKDKIDDYGSWYQGEAKIGLVVPKYMATQSISDLQQDKAKFNGQIVGIDPGAGIMKASEKAIGDYGLSYELVQGGEAAMIAALDKAYRQKSGVVITGWSPHWMFAKYDLKFLSDEKKSFGEAEGLHMLANKNFTTQRQDVASMLKRFKLNDKQIGGLESLIKDGMEPQAAAKQWVKDNRKLVDSWLK